MRYNGIFGLIAFGRICGLRALSLFYFKKKWPGLVFPFSVPVFGRISHREELLNIRDNIVQGTIRDRRAERRLRRAAAPVIVDCGVNVGVTVRWWFYLNPRSTVYGIDMMKEANDFTVGALSGGLRERYIPITAALGAETGRTFEIKFDDPLFGGNSLDPSRSFSGTRNVRSVTLDDCLAGYDIAVVDLLKVDIEDSAASMFAGAAKTLSRVKNILIEIHSEKERAESFRLLEQSGFRIRQQRNRHVWLERRVRTHAN